MYATDDLVKALVDPSCIFCNIWANRAEKNSPVIDLSENFFAIPDLHKKDEHHFLICPKYHLESYFSLDPEHDSQEIIKLENGQQVNKLELISKTNRAVIPDIEALLK